MKWWEKPEVIAAQSCACTLIATYFQGRGEDGRNGMMAIDRVVQWWRGTEDSGVLGRVHRS